MDKESIGISLVIIMLLIACGVIGFNQFSQTISVGDICFDMPQGFTISEKDESSVKISDGSNTVGLEVYGDNNTTRYVNEYIEYVHNKNYSTTLDKVTVDDYLVYKVTNNECKNSFYWFECDNKTYGIRDYVYYDKMDSTVYSLIGSVQPNSK